MIVLEFPTNNSNNAFFFPDLDFCDNAKVQTADDKKKERLDFNTRLV